MMRAMHDVTAAADRRAKKEKTEKCRSNTAI
jgi:hypothetical protein